MIYFKNFGPGQGLRKRECRISELFRSQEECNKIKNRMTKIEFYNKDCIIITFTSCIWWHYLSENLKNFCLYYILS